jgi:hypothetical protein
MKKPLTVALILFAARWLHAATTVTSSISSATVYADRAVITRTAEIDAVPGEQQYVFQHLPAGLLADSIQVSGGGSAQVTQIANWGRP